MFGSDNSSHDHPMGPLVWIHPQGTRGLGTTNPRVMSVYLHTTHEEFRSFPNHMVLEKSKPHQVCMHQWVCGPEFTSGTNCHGLTWIRADGGSWI